MNLQLDFFFYYFAAINIVSAFVFVADKRKAQKNKRRVSEKRLHIFEAFGGVFAIVPLMYFIRHKNRKRSYFITTYLILLVWVLILYVLLQHDVF